jgi:hypothetical protein
MELNWSLRVLNDTCFEVDETENLGDAIEDWHKIITRYRIDTRDQYVRKGLVALGWTPPQYWCNSHERHCAQSGCAAFLGGKTIPCRVVDLVAAGVVIDPSDG